jgi:DNA sulfur modification protein DndD
MKITLLGWESVGLRCPDMAIDLTLSGKVPKVSLVQMPNGTGKTTTLELIKAALNGAARDWSSAEVIRLKRAGASNDSGKFILRLLADSEPLTFELSFDFLEEKVSYRTTFKGAGGIKDDWVPPPDVRRFLNDRFVQLFIFDGELAQHLLNGTKTKASDAIDTLCQLEHLDKIESVIESDWQIATRNQSAKTASGLANYQAKERRLANRLSDVQTLRTRLVSESNLTNQKISELDEVLKRHLEYDQNSQSRKNQLEVGIRLTEEALAVKVRQILQFIRQPQFLSSCFAGSLETLKDQFDRVRLPESTSRQFFIELAEEENCVCGRAITETERQSILLQANRYLASELYSFINNLKSDITQAVVEADVVTKRSIDIANEELKELRRAHSDMRTEMQEIENDSVSNAGDAARRLADELSDYRSKLSQILLQIEKIDEHSEGDSTEESWSIRGLETELRRIRNTIAQITGTVELKAKLDLIRGIVKRTKELARQRLRSAILKDCNDKLAEILSNDPIKISKIGNAVALGNQDGASVGQTLAVGYTFLATLLERGTHKFPLVVDSPAGPLDDLVRAEIGRMIPVLCDQVVAFTISTEREHFLPALESVAGDSIAYLTAFRASSGMNQVVSALPSHAVKTENGVVVSGREYFVNFVIPREREEA